MAETPTDYLKDIGRRGGAARSEAKAAAGRTNLRKARAIRSAKRYDVGKPKAVKMLSPMSVKVRGGKPAKVEQDIERG